MPNVIFDLTTGSFDKCIVTGYFFATIAQLEWLIVILTRLFFKSNRLVVFDSKLSDYKNTANEKCLSSHRNLTN